MSNSYTKRKHYLHPEIVECMGFSKIVALSSYASAHFIDRLDSRCMQSIIDAITVYEIVAV